MTSTDTKEGELTRIGISLDVGPSEREVPGIHPEYLA